MKLVRKAGLIGAGLVIAALAGLAGPGWAHSGGRVQLFVDHLVLHPTDSDVWTVSLEMVDADSGSSAPGFDVIAEATDESGHVAGPVTLADRGGGRYSGPVTAVPGKWRLAIRAQSLPGGTPGVPLNKVYPLVLEPGKDVSIGSGRGGSSISGLVVPAASVLATAAMLGWFFRSRRRSAVRGVTTAVTVAVAAAGVAFGGPTRPAEAETPPDVQVRVERADKAGQTPLWIPVRVTVTDSSGGPLSVDHLVFAAARNSRGDEAGPFNLGPLEANDPTARGVHQGFIIVPYGGPWTITAVARTAHADPGVASTTLGRGSAEMVVDAPVSAGPAGGAGPATGTPDSEPLGVALLWAHTMVSIAWGIAIALLALLALPAGRRFLSAYGTNLLDGRLDRLSRSAWWLTGLVVGTGIYNLVNSVAYRVPLSPEQARRLFRLPYAQPYYVTLAAKLIAYAVMIAAAVPLIAEARRQAAVDETDEVSVVEDGPSPWEKPERLQTAKSAGSVALQSKAADVDVAAGWPGRPAPAGRARVPVAVMAVGATVIVAAVTLLKYFHLLGELSRAG